MKVSPVFQAPDGSTGTALAGASVDQLMNGSQPEEKNLLPADATPEQVLKHNPFAAKGTDVAPDGKKPVAAEIGKGPILNGQQPPLQAQPTPVQPQSNVTDPSMQAIRDLLVRNSEPRGEPQGGAGAAGGEENLFKVAWDVPQELVAALRHEDPVQNQAAVKTLINGVANGVLGMVQERMQELLTRAIPDMLSQREQIQSLNNAFYGRHPHLGKPELRDTVSKVAQSVAQYRKALGQTVDPYAQDFMDQVEGYMIANGLAVRPADHPLNVAGEQPQPKPKGGQPHFGGQGARPAGYQAPAAEDILAQIGL